MNNFFDLIDTFNFVLSKLIHYQEKNEINESDSVHSLVYIKPLKINTSYLSKP